MKKFDSNLLFDKKNILWGLSDENLQRIAGIRKNKKNISQLGIELKILVLLSDHIIQSASTYHESELSKILFKNHEELVRGGAVLFAIGEELNKNPIDYIEHYEKKKIESVKKGPLRCYHTDKGYLSAKELTEFGHILYRSGDISKDMCELWVKDIDDTEDINSLYYIIHLSIKDLKLEEKIRTQLKKITFERDQTSFTWQYVEPKLKKMKLPQPIIDGASIRLELFYLVSMSKYTSSTLYDSTTLRIDRSEKFTEAISPFELNLFMDFSEYIGIKKHLLNLNQTKILLLRSNTVFRRFLSNYRSAIELINGYEETIRETIKQKSYLTSEDKSKKNRALDALKFCSGKLTLPLLNHNDDSFEAILLHIDSFAQLSLIEVKKKIRDIYRSFQLVQENEGEKKLMPLNSDIQMFKEIMKKREDILKSLLQTPSNHRPIVKNDPSFIIARRYNSWYPSYFNVDGGCYVLVLPADKEGKSQCVVIDPGFKFLKTLKELGIEISDVNTIIVSHFHPDHMAGIFEFLSLRQTIEEKTYVYLNPTTFDSFQSLGTHNIQFQVLRPDKPIDLATIYEKSDGSFARVSLNSFPTYHLEMKQESQSLGFEFTFEQCPDDNFKRYVETTKLGLLGDTSFEANHEDLLKNLDKSNLVVLHLGSMQEKNKHGKHLYLNGLEKILRHMDTRIDQGTAIPDKLVVLSEFGLEHAEEGDFRNITEYSGEYTCHPGVSPLSYLQNWANNCFQRGDIIVSDIGLEIKLTNPLKIVINNNDYDPTKIKAEYDEKQSRISYVPT